MEILKKLYSCNSVDTSLKPVFKQASSFFTCNMCITKCLKILIYLSEPLFYKQGIYLTLLPFKLFKCIRIYT